MDKLRAQARIGATNLGYSRLRNHKTGKDESGAGRGWHDLTNALLSLTRWRTPLPEKQRVWLRNIAARLRRVGAFMRPSTALGPLGDSLDDVASAIAANKSEATTVKHHGLPKPDGLSVPKFLRGSNV